MIFNNNGTSLSSNIPMAEGYDGTIGAAWALVESARNDYAMFRGMLDIDAREYNITQESTGYVAESQIATLHEAAIGGIWKKIKDLFNKLIAKIKAIFHNFAAKFNSLIKSNKELVKKYGNEVMRKSNIDKLEIKWRKEKDSNNNIEFSDKSTLVFSGNDVKDLARNWDQDVDNRWKTVTTKILNTPTSATNAAEFKEAIMEAIWEDDTPSTYEIGEIGGMRNIVSWLETSDKVLKECNKTVSNTTRKLSKYVSDCDKYANDVARNSRTTDENGKSKASDEDLTEANHAYDMIVVEQSAVLVYNATIIESVKIYTAQARAAFMKGVTVSEKKLESGVYDDEYASAIAEAAADEVEDVISGALSSEELSDLTAASKNVMDADVTNDPDKLTYGPDCYTEPKSSPYSRADGSIDASIVGRNESTLFDFKLV